MSTRTNIWESLLDAEMNVKYWGHVARRFVVREKGLKVILALTTSSVLLSLPLWQRFPSGPILMAIVNAGLAVSLPILNYSERIETMANLRGGWSQLSVEFDRLWQRAKKTKSNSNDDFENEFRLLKERTVQLNVMETRLPSDPALVRKCQQEVRRARGLPDFEVKQNG
jgi:hypothetical protein